MDVFISYAHEDSEFVDRLCRALVARGREVWVDTEGIEPADRWKGSAQEAIERADAFAFVLSRASLASAACLDELAYGVSLNKRVIAICVEQAAAEVEKPPALSELSWIMMRPEDDFDHGVERLVHALDVDLELVRAHTRILVRARAWELADRRPSPLLRGEELDAAEEWLSRASLKGSPQPTELQREFIVASRSAAARRQRTVAGVASVVAAVSIALAIFALIQRSDAIDNQETAQSRLLASEAEATTATDASLGTLLALRALDIHDTTQAQAALRDALASLQTLVVLRGHALAVNSAVFSPDGSRVLTASDDGTARLWDPRTGQQLMVLRVSRFIVSDAAYSRDGRRIVTASRDGTGRIWNAHSGDLVAVLRTPAHMQAAGFSPDGTHVATTGDDGMTRIWDAASGRPLSALRGPHSYFVSAVYSPDGTRILTDRITASFKNLIRVFDARTSRLLSSYSPRVKASGQGFAIAADGARLAITADPIRIYAPRSGRPLTELMDAGIGGLSSADSAAFSADGSRLLGTSGSAEVWNARTGVPLRFLGTAGSNFTSGGFNPDGTKAVIASHNRSASVLTVNSYTELLTLPAGNGLAEASFSPSAINDASFSPDGARIVVAGDDGHVTIADSRDGARLGGFKDPSSRVLSAVFSPDGTRILTAGSFGPPRLWDARTRRLLITFGKLPVQKGASFSPDATQVAAGTPVGITLIWRVGAGPPVMRLHGPPNTPVEDAEFSRDGMRLVTANDDGTARVWDARTGRQLLILRAPSTADFAAVFSPDRAKVAAACADGTARVWDARSGRQLLVLSGHTDKVNAVAFSPDGSKLATASDDETARIWDAHDGQRLLVFKRTQPVTSVRFNADGSEVVVADGSGATVFSTTLAGPITSLQRLARSLVTRALTPAERRTYLAGI